MKIFNQLSQVVGLGVAIDLGTANTVVITTQQLTPYSFPSVVTMDMQTKQILAIGHDAKEISGRTPGQVQTIRPLQDGVINEFDAAEALLKHALNYATNSKISLVKPKVVIGVPSLITEVEMMALIDAARSAGAGQVHVLDEPVAAAVGVDLDILGAKAHLIVDIGGGTTDIMVLAGGRILVDNTLKTAGDEMDAAIQNYIRHKYNVAVSLPMAEDWKIAHAHAQPSGKLQPFNVLGRDVSSNLPKSVTMQSAELMEAILPVLQIIASGINNALTSCPPEVLNDISKAGVYLVGGGALIPGIGKYLQQYTGLSVKVANEPLLAVVQGNLLLLKNPKLLKQLAKQDVAYT